MQGLLNLLETPAT